MRANLDAHFKNSASTKKEMIFCIWSDRWWGRLPRSRLWTELGLEKLLGGFHHAAETECEMAQKCEVFRETE